MSHLNFNLLLVLSWCVIWISATCSNITCVTNSDDKLVECQDRNATRIITSLSDFTLTSETVHIYLTSGSHDLHKILNISDSVVETQIHGAPHGTIIECWNEAGIRFSENRTQNKVFLSNLTLKHCSTTTYVGKSYKNSAALSFKNVLYMLTNVTVENTAGHGLLAYQCNQHVISNCTFKNNTNGHVNISFQHDGRKKEQVLVKIKGTKFYEGASKKGSGGIHVLISDQVRCNFSITNSEFDRNKGLQASHVMIVSEAADLVINNTTFKGAVRLKNSFGVSINARRKIAISNSTFSDNDNTALRISSAQYTDIKGCSFINNRQGGIFIDMTASAREVTIMIRHCLVQSIVGTGIFFRQRSIANTIMKFEISYVSFIKNSRALYMTFSSNGNQTTNISSCTFRNHRITPEVRSKAVITINGNQAQQQTKTKHFRVILEKSSLEGNKGFHGDCSVLHVGNMKGITLNNITIKDNRCTGVTVSASNIQIENTVSLIRNFGLQGGGIQLKSDQVACVKNRMIPLPKFSTLIFKTLSRVLITNNTADTYGGGIFSDETCENRGDKRKCFFEFASGSRHMSKEVLTFSGNQAKQGGDQIFGGCLSNCSLTHITLINETDENNTFFDFLPSQSTPIRVSYCNNDLCYSKQRILLSKTNPNDTFWDFISAENLLSPSNFIEPPKRVAFCVNETSAVQMITCNNSHTVSVYRGEHFTIPLAAVDDFCLPSVSMIKARIDQKGNKSTSLWLKNESILQEAKRHCHSFSYALYGGIDHDMAKLELYLQEASFNCSSICS